MVWNLLPPAGSAALDAAVPFYGPPPSDVGTLASTKTNVLAVYAEQDTRITSSRVQVEEQLKKAGVQYDIVVYPGANHAFHNDTGDRYAPDQSQAAWMRTIEWFRRYLAA
jgi:carboxymethylenebutenolidase